MTKINYFDHKRKRRVIDLEFPENTDNSTTTFTTRRLILKITLFLVQTCGFFVPGVRRFIKLIERFDL